MVGFNAPYIAGEALVEVRSSEDEVSSMSVSQNVPYKKKGCRYESSISVGEDGKAHSAAPIGVAWPGNYRLITCHRRLADG